MKTKSTIERHFLGGKKTMQLLGKVEDTVEKKIEMVRQLTNKYVFRKLLEKRIRMRRGETLLTTPQFT